MGNLDVPQSTLQFLNIADIDCTGRFRADFGDLTAMIESVREKGLLQPITVSQDMKLLAGERRLRACREVGLTTIPALVRPVTGQIDMREVELFENIHRKDFEWPERAALVAEIDQLYKDANLSWSAKKTAELLERSPMSISRDLKLAKALNIVPELATMKTADEALKTLGKMEEQVITGELRKRQDAKIERDAGLSEGEMTVTPGEAVSPERRAKMLATMLRLAGNSYKVGDTFKGLAEMPSNGRVHIIECDPPYGIDLTAVKASKDSVTSNVHGYNEVAQDQYPAFLSKLSKELYRVASPNAWLVFWFGPTWHHEVLTALREANWQVDDIPAVWTKKQGQTLQPELYFARGYEPFFLARKGKPIMNKRGRLNVFEYAGEPGTKKWHPTQRPLELIEEILETLGVATNVVLVPFLGSGNTLRAAFNQGMSGLGWDISGEYKDRFMLAVEADTQALASNTD